ncbi:MAG: SGNH/GDSL hydrolase family protein [Bacteroidia bacterium]|nr:SGNH/GDSL hydrolase family protein [Bacteroidia bacterium]
MKKVVFAIALFIITLEVLLRVVGVYNTPNENNSGLYVNHYNTKMPTWFHHWTPNKTRQAHTTEFNYANQYNELGHRENSFADFVEDTITKKVIFLGDSFTEGDGAPADSTWVKRVEQLVRLNANKKLDFYNAGVCGSDVFFNNKMLEHKLIKANPNIVIECVNSSDLMDVMWFGGNERFNIDGTTSGKVGPKWLIIYNYSHIVRAIIHTLFKFNNNLVKADQLREQEIESAKLIEKQIEATALFCKQKNIRYYLVIHPCPHEIGEDKSSIKVLNQYLANKPYTINLFGLLDSFYKTNNIKQFSHAINGHYNPKGYWVMGEKIYTELAKRDSLFANN